MPRASREKELQYILLMVKPEGATFNELLKMPDTICTSQFIDGSPNGCPGPNFIIRKFSRATLYRLLKTLRRKKVIDKILEPRTKGKKGRPSYRYKIRSQIMTLGEQKDIGYGLKVQTESYDITFPHKKSRGMPFRCTENRRLGTTVKRLWPDEVKRKERFDKHYKGKEKNDPTTSKTN